MLNNRTSRTPLGPWPLALGPLLALFLTTTTLAVDIREDVRIPMRDGVELSANIILPDGPGPFRVILMRTPYGKGEADDGEDMAERGYALVVQDCRGTGDSAGDWAPIVSEHHDGLDTHQWVRAQPWCDGNIGTAGGSYLGHTQWAVAADSGESHKCMFTVIPMIDWYKDTAYRAQAVIDPRGVLKKFGLELDDDVEVRVWDSTAEVRYLVIPERPAGTDGMSKAQLAELVTRDSMIGAEKLASPA